jgi:hypothetical protein
MFVSSIIDELILFIYLFIVFYLFLRSLIICYLFMDLFINYLFLCLFIQILSVQ